MRPAPSEVSTESSHSRKLTGFAFVTQYVVVVGLVAESFYRAGSREEHHSSGTPLPRTDLHTLDVSVRYLVDLSAVSER